LLNAHAPDISFAFHNAARHCESPNFLDWKNVTNIFRYLLSSKYYKISFDGSGNFFAFSDADFGGNTNDKKSTSGFIILMGKSPICWASKNKL